MPHHEDFRKLRGMQSNNAHSAFDNLVSAFPGADPAEIRELLRRLSPDEVAEELQSNPLEYAKWSVVEWKKKPFDPTYNNGEEVPIRAEPINVQLDWCQMIPAERRKYEQPLPRCYPVLKLQCDKCQGHPVWSTRGYPVCYDSWKNREGELVMIAYWRLWRQLCKECKQPYWPVVTPEATEKALDTIRDRIFNAPEFDPSKPRTRDPEFDQHKRELCDGCAVRECRFAPKEGENIQRNSNGSNPSRGSRNRQHQHQQQQHRPHPHFRPQQRESTQMVRGDERRRRGGGGGSGASGSGGNVFNALHESNEG